jgi:tetratricopeptide (TPR) repeat protein
MDFLGSIFETALGGLPTAAKALIPEHIRRRAAARFDDLNPFRKISANHDLVRALRIAWVEAASEILDAAKHGASGSEDIARFEAVARHELVALRDAAFDRRAHPGETAIDAHLHTVLQGVPEFVIAEPDGKPERTLTRSFTQTLAFVTRWDAREVPTIFGQIAAAGLPVHGTGEPRTFGDLVFAAFAELIKDPQKYPQAREAFHIAMDKLARDLAEATLTATRGLDRKLDDALARLDALAVLREGAERYLAALPDIAFGVARIDARTERIEAAIAQLIARHDASDTETNALCVEVDRLRRSGEVRDQAIVAFLRDVGETPLSPDQYPAQLARFLERYRELLAEVEKPQNLPKQFEAIRQEAAEKIQDGALDSADALLADLREQMAIWRLEQQATLDQAKRDEAAVLGYRAGIAKTRLRYREAAALVAEAADLTAFDRETSWSYRLEQGDNLYDQGNEFGDNTALGEAIVAYRDALVECTRKRVPLDWAMTQNNLGNALSTLGERESSIGRLEEAIAAYRAALEVRSRGRVLDWAATQNNLGIALSTLGERESGIARLEEAVATYRAALEELSRERVPLDWAATQNNLGTALSRLGQRESGIARLEEAVAAYRTALEERTRERVPLQWAMTQNNLGNTLRTLGERESGIARLEEAVATYRAALEVWTRERVPLDWAMTQDNLGNALWTLGERESGIARLEEAIAAYRAALEVRTRERVPLDWAATQNNLGAALSTLGEREGGVARLEEAVAAYRAALQEWTRDVPLQSATTQNNLGQVEALLESRRNEAVRKS